VARKLTWSGRDLPAELQELPAGDVIEPVDRVPPLSADEEDGLQAALDSVAVGGGLSDEESRRRIAAALCRGR